MTTKRRRWNVTFMDQAWGVFELSKGGWWVYRAEFNTHTEALAYADRMARTVTVELPRDNTTVPLPACMEKEEKPITLTRWGEQIIIECTAQGVEEVIFIHDDELKPLALALLAHHYRNKR
ncbi:hypothetical protein ACN4DT_03195 [Corynebacterium macclintockiae]|uniref:hypothetical protein n=1 Tax=Corynebacterium macclintockiae TaxID=2913501 RepID=UPI003EBE4DA6